MKVYNLLRKHQPDPAGQRLDNSLFVNARLVISRAMIKPVNGYWQLVGRTTGR